VLNSAILLYEKARLSVFGTKREITQVCITWRCYSVQFDLWPFSWQI